MKLFLLAALFLALVSSVQAQRKETNSISKSINDDGKRLTLTIDALYNARKIYFTNTYDVAGRNQKQKDALIKRVTDSLAIPNQRRTIKL